MATNLKRTTIFLTEEQHEKLRRLAFEQRTSMAKLIRDATLEILEDEEDIREGLRLWPIRRALLPGKSTSAVGNSGDSG